MVRGTSEGWSKTMQLIGVGYRAAVSGKKLTLNLGYSNPVEFDIPEGLACAVRPSCRSRGTGRACIAGRLRRAFVEGAPEVAGSWS